MSPRNCVRVSMVFVAAALSVSAGFSQGRGGTTAAGGRAVAEPPAHRRRQHRGNRRHNTRHRTAQTRHSIHEPDNTPPQARMQQPIFVSGQVLLEDGTPPTESRPDRAGVRRPVAHRGIHRQQGLFFAGVGAAEQRGPGGCQ